MEKVNIGIVAWILIGVSVLIVGTVIPADCTPAYSVELTTVDEDSTNNVTRYTDLPPTAQEEFGDVRSGNDTTVNLTIYDRHFADTTVQYSGTYYRVEQSESVDCGTPLGTLLQYAGLLLVALMSLIFAIRWSYAKTN